MRFGGVKWSRLFDAYAASLVLNRDAFLFAPNEEYGALKAPLARRTRSFLRPGDIDYLFFFDLLAFEQANDGRSGLLSAPENADLRSAVAQRLVDIFKVLPVRASFRVELPAFPALGEFAVEIRPGISLVAAKHPFEVPESRQDILIAALRRQDQHDAVSTFLQFDFDSFPGAGLHSLGVQASISTLKQLVFIQKAFSQWANASARTVPSRATLTVGSSLSTITLPAEIANLCGALIPHEDALKVREGGLTLLSNTTRPAANDAEKAKCICDAVYEMRRYLDRVASPDFGTIAASIEWYQDSLHSGNQTLGYLAACIGLEALIGSEDQLDLMSKRLEDRYAFLMGNGRAERERLREDMRSVLNLRGKLVHARATRLSAENQAQLGKVQNMLLNTIWRELHNMYRSNP